MKKRPKANQLAGTLGENYGWAVCAACLIALFCNSGLTTTGFAAYQPYLIRLGRLTNTQSSTLIMIRTFTSLLGMLAADRLIRLFEAKRVVIAGMLLGAFSFWIFGTAAAYPGYCAAAAAGGLAHGAGGVITVSVIIVRWFNLHRATALGICMSSTGLSSLTASPIITSVVESRGLRTSFYGEAVIVILMALIVQYLAYSDPSHIGRQAVGSEQVQSDRTYASRPAAPFMMGIMILMLGFFGISANIMTSHISVLYAAEGYASGSVALITALYGGAMAVGKLLYGIIADRIGTIPASTLFYVLVVLGGILCCLAGNGSVPAGLAAVLILGTGLAVSSVSVSVYAAGSTTRPLYAQTITRFNLSFNLGPLLFGPVPGMIADMTGSYTGAYRIMTAIAAVSSAVLLFTYQKIRRDDRPTEPLSYRDNMI